MNTLDVNQKQEGKVTKRIENQTARVPSLTYMGLAVGSMIASAAFMLTGRKQVANFIGQWAPSFLIIGLYNKVVKIENEFLEQSGQSGRMGSMGSSM